MESKGEIYISPKYKKADFQKLRLSADSDANWDEAVSIFRDRVQGRFLNQIHLLESDIKTNGFAIMALDCLLIETLLQFKFGAETTKPKNIDAYSNFLCTEFHDIFDSKSKARRFYSDVRCGILHSAQTKGKTQLTDDTTYALSLSNGILKVSVLKISKHLENYFLAYCAQLLDKNNAVVRENFIKKMKFVCRKYDI